MSLIKFNGTTDYLKWATLAASIQNVPTGAFTFLAGVKHNSLTAWQGYVNLASGTGAGTNKAGLSKSDASTSHDVYSDVAGASQDFALPLTNAADTLVVMSKPAGSVSANASKKVGSGGSWAHAVSSITRANQIAAAQLQVGTWQLDPTDMMNGWMAVVAIWNVELTQAQRIACGANWKTSDIYNAHATPPVVLIEMNVAKASLVNLGSGAISTPTSVGTTLDAAETFGGWNFDGVGVPETDNFFSVL